MHHAMIAVNGATIDYTDTGGTVRRWCDPRLAGDVGIFLRRIGGCGRIIACWRCRGAGTGALVRSRAITRATSTGGMEDVAAFLDALNVPQAHIVGFSDGGETALLVPIIRPDLARSVAAWGAVGHFTPELRPRVQRNWPATWVDEATRALHGPEHIDRMVLGWVTAMKQIIDSGGDVSYSAADRIACPLLLMLGRDDALNPVALGEAFVERTPNGRLVVFDCGHAIHIEQRDTFRATLSEFLQSVERSTV